MAEVETLRKLESLLERFLDRAVAIKENRLSVIEGINRLDDIARTGDRQGPVADRVGQWFATHNRWLTDSTLRDGDIKRISGILGDIRRELNLTEEGSPAEKKIGAEINRWQTTAEERAGKITLKRGPEEIKVTRHESDTIGAFDSKMEFLHNLYKDYTQDKKHILSVLDDLLVAAKIKPNKDALILSAFVIYYLKQNGYKVEPYVKKLREAETEVQGGVL